MELETNKYIKKLENVSNNVNEYFIRDIKSILQFVLLKYDVKDRYSNKVVRLDEIEKLVNENFNLQKKESCFAITSSGNRCCRKQATDSKYCKLHQQSNYNNKLKNTVLHFKNTSELITQNHYNNLQLQLIKTINEDNKINNTNNKNDYIKKLIDDSFYYIDNKYIYDINTKEKVGYIKYNESLPKYILTDDPFELECIEMY